MSARNPYMLAAAITNVPTNVPTHVPTNVPTNLTIVSTGSP